MKWIAALGALLFMTTACSTKKQQASEQPLEDSDVIVLESDTQDQLDQELNSYNKFSAHTVYDDGEQLEEYKDQKQVEVLEEVTNNFEQYEVQKNETLMIISFKLFGKMSMWRNLYTWNEDILVNESAVTAGMKLKYVPPAENFYWQPDGNPYLILRGDTLGKISGKVYNGQRQYWRDIMNNNQPMIKDPNLIFAGFTLYYLPFEQLMNNKAQREFASESGSVE